MTLKISSSSRSVLHRQRLPLLTRANSLDNVCTRPQCRLSAILILTRCDLEQEVNGLYTFDREEKIPAVEVKAIIDAAQRYYYEHVLRKIDGSDGVIGIRKFFAHQFAHIKEKS